MNSTVEEWREIPGYDGRYQVSNLGNVRSMPYIHYQKTSHPGVMTYKHHPGKIITPTDNGHGYKIVGLQLKSKRKNYYVHRLVASAFLPNPHGLKEVNHIDFDRSNNACWNLEWTDRKGNANWSKERMMHPTPAAPLSKIGMRYISIRDGKYKVSIRVKSQGYQFYKCFNTLEEAVQAKETFINGKEYFAR